MDETKAQEGKRILVTGFGPFGKHHVNASWVAVKQMESLWEERGAELKPHTLQTREIPVEYDYVQQHLPHVYEECSPDLCVHVGVSPYVIIKLERHGRNTPYIHPDNRGTSPVTFRCVDVGPDVIATKFNLERVCENLTNVNGNDVSFGVSQDAGRYLCDFIYYKSLHMGKCPVVFVHVPDLDQPYSREQLGRALRDLLEVLLAEMGNL